MQIANCHTKHVYIYTLPITQASSYNKKNQKKQNIRKRKMSSAIINSPLSLPSFSLFFLVVIFPSVITADSTTLLKNVCNKVKNPDHCMKMLNSHDNPVTNKGNATDLARIYIDMASINATETYKKLESLINETGDPDLKERLNVCYNRYDLILSALNHLKEKLPARDYKNAMLIAFMIIDAADKCEDSFNNPPSYRFPIYADNLFVNFAAHTIIVALHLIVNFHE